MMHSTAKFTYLYVSATHRDVLLVEST